MPKLTSCFLSTFTTAFVCAIVLFGAGSKAAHAATNDVYAISCPTSVHVADFVTCTRGWETTHGATGMIAASSPTRALSALVRVTGTFLFTPTGKGACCWSQNSGTMSPVKLDGTPITTDADLVSTDHILFGPLRSSGTLSGPITIPLPWGQSPIGNEAWEVDASTGLNQVVPNPGAVPLGTLVIAKWQDGTTAQFVRTNSVPTLMWVYVPGSMRNAAGNPITPITGTRLLNPHTSGTGSGVVPIGSGANPGDLYLDGGSFCTGSTTLTVPDDGVYIFQFFFPC
jgi:hypothetical protein